MHCITAGHIFAILLILLSNQTQFEPIVKFTNKYVYYLLNNSVYVPLPSTSLYNMHQEWKTIIFRLKTFSFNYHHCITSISYAKIDLQILSSYSRELLFYRLSTLIFNRKQGFQNIRVNPKVVHKTIRLIQSALFKVKICKSELDKIICEIYFSCTFFYFSK